MYLYVLTNRRVLIKIMYFTDNIIYQMVNVFMSEKTMNQMVSITNRRAINLIDSITTANKLKIIDDVLKPCSQNVETK